VESHFHSYPNCRSKNRGTQNFELLHNSLLTLLLDDYGLRTIINHRYYIYIIGNDDIY
ncbi:unnamed protein product, partial [Callosobruchus maculatus]